MGGEELPDFAKIGWEKVVHWEMCGCLSEIIYADM